MKDLHVEIIFSYAMNYSLAFIARINYRTSQAINSEPNTVAFF